jgi:membrane-associated phospholipid phosphatase
MAVTVRLPEVEPDSGPLRATGRRRLRLTSVDVWTLAYVVVASVMLARCWSLPLPTPGLLVVAHLLMLATVVLAAMLRERNPGALLAEFYPVLFVTAAYKEIGILNTARGVSHDLIVQGWDQAIFGGQPSFDWVRAWPWPWLSWVLVSAYLSYYFIVAGAPLGLWLSGRRHAARQTILRIMATFYLCYTIFLLFPVAGPRYLFPLAQNAATAVAPAQFTQHLLNTAAAWGTAFPSSHVAVAAVASLSAFAYWRAFGIWFVVASVLLGLGTVYGQFHYGVDALAGLAAGIAMLRVGSGREEKA